MKYETTRALTMIQRSIQALKVATPSKSRLLNMSITTPMYKGMPSSAMFAPKRKVKPRIMEHFSREA